MDSNLDEAISGMILSASGWRGVFAENGNEESAEPLISKPHSVIAAAAARVFSDYLTGAAPGKNIVIVGRDTRPSGEAIAEAMLHALISSGREVWYAGIVAAPEIMAYTRTAGKNSAIGGFIYISASHNPIGHNGIKFGLTDGGVLQAGETAILAAAFRRLTASPSRVEELLNLCSGIDKEKLKQVYEAGSERKKAAIDTYRDFCIEVISGSDDKKKAEHFFFSIREGLKEKPMGIVMDFNGSARTVSIDRDFLQSIGVGFNCLNDKPGEIVHRIVPEGVSLEPCRIQLEELHNKDPSVILGVTPDCDGDRGNLVYWDDKKRCARILEAQEVFALACVAELSSLVWTGELEYDDHGKPLVKTAIAVNDPTSLRIDRIAQAFGAQVFRAETGEANVVGLARKLRENGYLVRILGEGSSGGTIIHPSAVRDPIDTLGALLKLLAIRGGSALFGMGLYEIWCKQSCQTNKYRSDFSLTDIIASLPAFVSTGAYTEDALLRVKTGDHGLLKKRYQKIFLRDWEEKKEILKEKFGISGWEAIAYNGMEERRGISCFGEAERGGLKIIFYSDEKYHSREDLACIWMRGSGTEPVFRVMADAAARPAEVPPAVLSKSAESEDGRCSAFSLERILIEWQRLMVQEADEEAAP